MSASVPHLLLIACGPGAAWPALSARLDRTIAPTPIDELCFALGTGGVRADVVTATLALCDERRLLSAPALDEPVHHASYNNELVVDFFTEKERPKCRVHLFGLVSAADASASELLVNVSAELAAKEIHVVVHAVIEGAPGAPRSVQAALDELVQRIEGKATIATVVGRDRVIGDDVSWEELLGFHHAVVMDHEGRNAESARDALALAYTAGEDDATVAPTRIEGYPGANGDLCAEFGDNDGDVPIWEWQGADVALFAFAHGHGLGRLAAILARSGLPEDVAARVAVRGRAVFAFRPEWSATLARMGERPGPVVVDTAHAGPTLASRAQAAGLRVLRLADEAHQTLAGFVLDGECVPIGERVTAVSAAEALELVRHRVLEGEAGLILGCVGRAEGAEVHAQALIDAVLEKGGGALVVVADEEAMCAGLLGAASTFAAPAEAAASGAGGAHTRCAALHEAFVASLLGAGGAGPSP